MGYYFAFLLTRNQSLRRRGGDLSPSDLDELLRFITSILHLAINTTDERTEHLTDHIYHIITFSTLILCQILHRYRDKLRLSHNIESLHLLVSRTVDWLRSIGLSCHVAQMLARTIEAQHKKIRPTETGISSNNSSYESPALDFSAAFPEYLTAEMFDIDTDNDTWPMTWNSVT